MTDDDAPFVEATHRALVKHGSADVTTQDIADETDRSKAALHYHYDGKEDLFRTFLDHLYADFETLTADPPGASPAERLVGLLRTVLATEDEDSTQFTTAFLEIKAQSPYRDGFQSRLARFDERVRERVETLVAAGVDSGQFPADTDPAAVASFVTTYVHGVWTRSVVAEESVTDMRERLVESVLDRLAEDAVVDETVGLSAETPPCGDEAGRVAE
jgi:AcrR family transcriptional regulator